MTDFTRTLIHIPIVHTPVDMGGLAEPIRKIKIEKLGRQGWMSNVASIEQMWKEIRRRVGLAVPVGSRLSGWSSGLRP